MREILPPTIEDRKREVQDQEDRAWSKHRQAMMLQGSVDPRGNSIGLLDSAPEPRTIRCDKPEVISIPAEVQTWVLDNLKTGHGIFAMLRAMYVIDGWSMDVLMMEVKVLLVSLFRMRGGYAYEGVSQGTDILAWWNEKGERVAVPVLQRIGAVRIHAMVDIRETEKRLEAVRIVSLSRNGRDYIKQLEGAFERMET